MSNEYIKYLKKEKKYRLIVLITQLAIITIFIFLWELAARLELINTFLLSSPSNIIKTIISLYKNHTLFNHIFVTVYETFISFILSTLIGIFIASILWWNKFIAKVLDPYLTVLNSLPKVALGPIIIIWMGASIKSIIFLALLISTILTILSVYNGFNDTDKNKIKLLKSFKANKLQIFTNVIFRSNLPTIINSIKINVSMSLIGVIMGELLVSKEGIGYLIMYGSGVFNLNLVITATILLCIVATLMYYIVSYIERKLLH